MISCLFIVKPIRPNSREYDKGSEIAALYLLSNMLVVAECIEPLFSSFMSLSTKTLGRDEANGNISCLISLTSFISTCSSSRCSANVCESGGGLKLDDYTYGTKIKW